MIAKLYIEGGGDRSKSQAARFREGWNRFFEKAGVGARVSIVRGGSRTQTFKRFSAAVSQPRPRTIPILLVDSESAVRTGHSVWRHLKEQDGWSPPSGSDDQAFLMVQAMETWFLADRGALRRYFRAGFRENKLRKWPDLEGVPKATVIEALDSATAKCSKRYAKGRVSFELLEEIDPVRVAEACPHARDLMERLKTL